MAAAAATPAAPPLLDPAVLAAAAGLRKVGWMDQLMAACSSSIAVLSGATSGASQPADAAGPAGAGSAVPAAPLTTALLLRLRQAAAAEPPDADSLRFMAAFVQRLQQVACCMLPPAALLDCIGSMAASSLALLRSPAGGASPTSLPLQRVQLVAAGLHVAQHMLALDAGCREAALGALTSSAASSSPAPPGRAALSSRVTLSGGPAAAALAAPAAAAAQPSWLAATGSAAALAATEQVMQQHPAAFGAASSSSTPSSTGGGGLLPVLLTGALWLGPQHEAVAAGALGCILEMARALQGSEARAGLAPVLTSGGRALASGAGCTWYCMPSW